MKKILLLANFLLFSILSDAQIDKAKMIKAIQEHVSAGDLKMIDISNFSINSQYTESKTGITHVYLRQTIENIEIYNSSTSLHFDKNGNLFHFNNAFIKDAQNKVSKSNISVDANKAAQLVASSLGINLNQSLQLSKTAPNEFVLNDPTASSQPIKTKLYYFFTNNKLVPVWNVEIMDDENNDWWNKRVDANTGIVIDKNNWVTKCDVKQIYHSNEMAAPIFNFEETVQGSTLNKTAAKATYNILPQPLESPKFGSRQIIDESVVNLSASPYGWHDTDGVDGADFTITKGNNVWAKDDTTGRNTMTGSSPNGGDSLVFDFPYDINSRPFENLKAGIVNLFYWNNVMHDIMYNYGFDETAGNFQNNNYNKDGLGNDFVFADAQDGSGTGNANFATPNDGQNGRMQMYLWPTSTNTNLMTVKSPSNLARAFGGAISSFGSKVYSGGIIGKLIEANDSTANYNYGCSALINPDSVAGKIVVIYNSTACSNVVKVKNAQNAGAIAAIVVNNTTANPTAMTGKDATITIPSIIITQSNGDTLLAHLKNGEEIVATIRNEQLDGRVYQGEFDNGVMAHEYGHGISNRLTGGPSNSNCLTNQEQAGEGWSDFFALVTTDRLGTTDATSNRGIGTFVNNQDTSALGIRTFKYSRDMKVNPVTYNGIKTQAIPHGIGFVFCSMLYDIYLDMIDAYGFDKDIYNGKGGNNKALQLVMMGLKLQPCSPGFVDARNAIIAADSILNNKANYELLWKAFARRGLGASADQKSSNSRSDGIQAFDIPRSLWKTSTQEILNSNDVIIYPNPSKGIFNIDFLTNVQINQIEAYDIMGKLVATQIVNKDIKSSSIDLSNYTTGVYLLKLKSDFGTLIHKVIVE
ncbi:MAG: T9SS C-terminal target domain-containing protein [Bacteroidetes bacterium]|nr:T9SS C-terminal target domain-containing protein [Bacteroidota bacterium]